jgi:transposase InsO family protein
MTSTNTSEGSNSSANKPPTQPLRETPAQQITSAVLDALTPELQAIGTLLKTPPATSLGSDLAALVNLVNHMRTELNNDRKSGANDRQQWSSDLTDITAGLVHLDKTLGSLPKQFPASPPPPPPVNLTSLTDSQTRVEQVLDTIKTQAGHRRSYVMESLSNMVLALCLVGGAAGGLWLKVLEPMKEAQEQSLVHLRWLHHQQKQQNEILCSFRPKGTTLAICQK